MTVEKAALRKWRKAQAERQSSAVRKAPETMARMEEFIRCRQLDSGVIQVIAVDLLRDYVQCAAIEAAGIERKRLLDEARKHIHGAANLGDDAIQLHNHLEQWSSNP